MSNFPKLRVSLASAVAFIAIIAAGIIVPSPADASTGAKFEPPDGQVYLGVSTDHNVSTGGSDRLPLFDNTLGITHPAIFNQYSTPDGSFSAVIANATQGPAMTPMVSWNLPFDNSQITNGSQDANLDARIAEVKTYNKPIFLRPDWEFNGSWYPHWNNPATTPAQYVASWQYVVDRFKAAGVTNVAWVWCPNVLDYFDTSGTRFRTSLWYPGDSYVDWVGLDAYPQSNTQSTLLDGTDGMNQMAQFAGAHGKPMVLAEWALNTPHPDDPTVVDWVLAWQDSYPQTVKANMWFDFITQGKDFTLADHPLAAAEFRFKVASHPSEYLTSLVSQAAPTPTPTSAPTPTPTPTPAPTTPGVTQTPGPTPPPTPAPTTTHLKHHQHGGVTPLGATMASQLAAPLHGGIAAGLAILVLVLALATWVALHRRLIQRNDADLNTGV